MQPDRGDRAARKGDYHDLTLAPRHAYVAFYFWLRARSASTRSSISARTGRWSGSRARRWRCREALRARSLIGATPVIYPFIVNNPGEAAQAKRRIGAAAIGHLTPPLVAAGSHGATLELEGLFDEYRRRLKRSIHAAPARSPR